MAKAKKTKPKAKVSKRSRNTKASQKEISDATTEIAFDQEKRSDFLERHRDSMDQNPHVISYGFGLREKNGKFTDEMCFIVVVDAKSKKVAKKFWIPKMIEGIPTDVVVVEKRKPEVISRIVARARKIIRAVNLFKEGINKDWKDQGLPRIVNKQFETLVGGIPIRNRDVSGNAGSLGAIVFDSQGNACGITSHHGIAGKNAVIQHPLEEKVPEYRIGKQVDACPFYDITLFKLDSKKSFAPKVIGEKSEIELGIPIRPQIGWEVECYGRMNHAKGVVIGVTQERNKNQGSKFFNKWFEMIHIQPNSDNFTEGGDSGSVWVDSLTKRPIGIHKGSPKNSSRDVAPSMVDIAEAFKFEFLPPPKSKAVWEHIEDPHTRILTTKENLVVISQPNNSVDTFSVRVFDKSFKLTKVKPFRFTGLPSYFTQGLAIAELKTKRGSDADPIILFWRGWDNVINALEFKVHSGDLKLVKKPSIKLGREFIAKSSPAATSFNNSLALAYVGFDNQIQIVLTETGKSWVAHPTGIRSASAPALTTHKDQLILSWKDLRSNTLKIASFDVVDKEPVLTRNLKVKQKKRALRKTQQTGLITDLGSIREVIPSGAPALCSDGKHLYLSFSYQYRHAIKVNDKPPFTQVLKGTGISTLMPYDELMLAGENLSLPISPMTRKLPVEKDPTLAWFQGELIYS